MRMSPLVAHLMIVGRLLAQQADTSVVETGDAIVYPYGHSQPVVTCAPLRACVIELEAGERVLATALGDTERWLVDQTLTVGRTPVVIIKPTACDIATNLVVSTDRRVYDVALESPVCGRRPVRYTRRVRFSYQGEGGALVAATSPDAFHPESLSFTYRWRSDRHVAWSPVAVYDDGTHAYVRLSDSARHGDLPILLLELEDKSTSLLTYLVSNDTYITDRLFSRAILRDKGRQIEIVNTRLFVPR
jgi:P-type conjugative transfer protein TrbG